MASVLVHRPVATHGHAWAVALAGVVVLTLAWQGLFLSIPPRILDETAPGGGGAAPQAQASRQTPPRPPAATPLPAGAASQAGGVPEFSAVVAAVGASIQVYAAPDPTRPSMVLPGRNDVGQPETFLVAGEVPGWFRVLLPVRPAGTYGWLAVGAVTVGATELRVVLSRFHLELFVDGQLRQVFTVAVGAPATPTPVGFAYVWATETYAAPPYTPGIFALSTFSPVLLSWPGGGRTGIHGWTDPSVMGKRASNGCVRMAPKDFAQLLNAVPLGTPVDIVP